MTDLWLAQFDEMDSAATHIFMYSMGADGLEITPLGTLRLFADHSDAHGDAQLGRVAVEKSSRGQGLGALMMERAHTDAQSMGFKRAIIHAQEDKSGFYSRLGYLVTDSTVFYEEGKAHIKMAKSLF